MAPHSQGAAQRRRCFAATPHTDTRRGARTEGRTTPPAARRPLVTHGTHGGRPLADERKVVAPPRMGTAAFGTARSSARRGAPPAAALDRGARSGDPWPRRKRRRPLATVQAAAAAPRGDAGGGARRRRRRRPQGAVAPWRRRLLDGCLGRLADRRPARLIGPKGQTARPPVSCANRPN